MNKLSIILDLDNTIFDTYELGKNIYMPLFHLISREVEDEYVLIQIKNELMFRPFLAVAEKYLFTNNLRHAGVSFLQNLICEQKIEPFDDYSELLKVEATRYLVTAGFQKLQMSKIMCLGIEKHFKEIHVLDQFESTKTKRDTFVDIIKRNNLIKSDVIVIGDDIESEIKYANQLGLKAILYKKEKILENQNGITNVIISNYRALKAILKNQDS